MVKLAVNERIVLWRRLRGWTQQDLAQAAGTNHSTISRIEAGKARVTTDMLERIADALGVTVPQFYGEMGPESDGAAK